MSFQVNQKVAKDADREQVVNDLQPTGNEGIQEREPLIAAGKAAALDLMDAVPAGSGGWNVNIAGHASQDHTSGYDMIAVTVSQAGE